MTEQGEKECIFCLEIYLGRRKTTAIWYSGLYPCECRFPSHWQCLLKWQWQCDDILECPICRSEVIEPPQLQPPQEPQVVLMPDSSRIFYPEPSDKKICWIFIYLLILYMFLSGMIVLLGKH